MKRKEFYTTSEVAKILHVAVGSVINWVDNKQIKAIITPGGHRKISVTDLVSFLETHNYATPSFLLDKKLVYLIDDEDYVHDFFSEVFKNIQGVELRKFFSGTEALLSMGKESPEIIVVDILMPDVDGIKVISNIRTNESLKNIQIIAISGDSSKKDISLSSGADIFIKKPIEINEFKKAFIEMMN